MPPSVVVEPPVWVLDTNVLVSGLLSSAGPPGRLLDAVLGRRLVLALDDRMEEEYVRVLRRPKFSFDLGRLEAVFALFAWQRRVSATARQGRPAPDAADEKFLEVAAMISDQVLVTGNLRHFQFRAEGMWKYLVRRKLGKNFTGRGEIRLETIVSPIAV